MGNRRPRRIPSDEPARSIPFRDGNHSPIAHIIVDLCDQTAYALTKDEHAALDAAQSKLEAVLPSEDARKLVRDYSDAWTAYTGACEQWMTLVAYALGRVLDHGVYIDNDAWLDAALRALKIGRVRVVNPP